MVANHRDEDLKPVNNAGASLLPYLQRGCFMCLLFFFISVFFTSTGSMLPSLSRRHNQSPSSLTRVAQGWPGPTSPTIHPSTREREAEEVAPPPASPSRTPESDNPEECYRPDKNAIECIKPDPSNGRAWRDPGPVNISALPSHGKDGGMYPGRYAAGPLDLVVCYLSRAKPKNAERRAVIRRSMVLLDKATFRVGYYWLMTPPTDPAALASVLEENATYGDIAFAVPETVLPDGELTNKIWNEMRVGWSQKQAPFWAKMDDDAAILWDRFLPTLYKEMPREGLCWCSQGSGQGGIYCTGPYLFSMDVIGRLADDEGACCGGGNIDDWWFPTRVWNNRAMWNWGSDRRWHNDDMGIEYICACKPWTLTSDSIVVHKVGPSLLDAWLTNKTRFALLGQPQRRYAYNVCDKSKPSPKCNYVPECKGQAPAPLDCIIQPTELELVRGSIKVDSRGY